jgi:hypothetical protein
MVRFRYIIVNTVHKGGDDDDDNNNNNSLHLMWWKPKIYVFWNKFNSVYPDISRTAANKEGPLILLRFIIPDGRYHATCRIVIETPGRVSNPAISRTQKKALYRPLYPGYCDTSVKFLEYLT